MIFLTSKGLRWAVALTSLILLFGLLPPFILSLTLLFLLMVFCSKLKHGEYLFVIVISLIFSLVNKEKLIVSDLYNYKEYFDLIKSGVITIDFSNTYISVKPTEVMFYIYNLTLGHFFDFKGYMFVTSFIIYGVIGYSAIELMRYISDSLELQVNNVVKIYLILFFAMFVAITFSQTLHLVRQYLALSFLFLGISLLIRDNKLTGCISLIFSILTHNSMVLPLIILGVAIFTFRSKYHKISLVSVGFVFIISKVFMYYISLRYPYFNDMDNGSIPLSLILIDFILATVFFFVFYVYKVEKTIAYYICLFYLLFLFSVSSNEFVFLRFYFAMDFIRVIMFSYILYYLSLGRFDNFLIFGFVLFPIVFILRLHFNPWFYGFDMDYLIGGFFVPVLFDLV